MDLNLYLSPPLSPRPQSHHLGFDLALTSLPTMPPPPDDLSRPHPEPAEPATDFDYPYLPISAPGADVAPSSSSYSSSQQQSLPDPSFCLPSLIEPSRRRRLQPYPFGRERSVSSSQLMHDIMSSQRALDAARKHRDVAEEEAEEEEDNWIFAANFECNICLDLSKDPVVTSCGHLFCWPCLYQWLHLHSDHTECPVCKGQVDEAKIVPIYGRGGAEAAVKEGSEDGGGTGLKIPPRPHGHRVDSLRQQLQRPVSRRPGEGNSMLWSRILDDENENLQTLLDGARSMVLSRLREWRMQREEGNNESGVNIEGTTLPIDNNASGPLINTTSSLRLETDHWHRSPLHSLGSTHSRAPRGFGSGNSQAGTSTSSVNNLHHEPLLNGPHSETMASDQASASSSMTVIHGDVVHGDVAAHDAAREPYAAGSSRPPSKRRKE